MGQGGMGAVYKVRQKELDRLAALKILPPETATIPGFQERFTREARLLASLSHPQIVTVFEFGRRDAFFFLLMEFVDGVTLRQALLSEPIRKLNSKEALTIVSQLCDALQFAHDEGVVHRDIKPENILIDRRGRIKIADFGLARLLDKPNSVPTLTGSNQILGTPIYMAPEQVEGAAVIDHRADIYSLGVVFYELLTGELPLGRFQPPSQRTQVDVRLDDIVLRTLEKEPDRRYQQASQVKTAVDQLDRGVSGRAAAGAGESHTVHAARKSGHSIFTTVLLLGVLVLVPILAVGSVLIFSWSRSRAMAADRMVAAERAAAERDYMAAVEAQRRDVEQAALKQNTRPQPFAETSMEGPTSVVWRLDAAVFPSISPDKIREIEASLNTVYDQYLKLERRNTSIALMNRDVAINWSILNESDAILSLENQIWNKIDSICSVEEQTLLRQRLNFYESVQDTANIASIHSSGGAEDDSMGGMGMGSGVGSAPSMPGVGPTTGETSVSEISNLMRTGIPVGAIFRQRRLTPGLLGWSPQDSMIHLRVERQGRWFRWIQQRDNQVTDSGMSPDLPPQLFRFLPEENTPNLSVRAIESALTNNDFELLNRHFTPTGKLCWILYQEVDPRHRRILATLNYFNSYGRPFQDCLRNAGLSPHQLLESIDQRLKERTNQGHQMTQAERATYTLEFILEESLGEPMLHLNAQAGVAPTDRLAALHDAAQLAPPAALDLTFALDIMDIAGIYDDAMSWEFQSVEQSENVWTGTLLIKDANANDAESTLQLPCTFVLIDGVWKLDSVGDLELYFRKTNPIENPAE